MARTKGSIPEEQEHGHDLFSRVARMAQESGIPADCLVERALDTFAACEPYKKLVEGHKLWRDAMAKAQARKKTG